MKSYNNGALSGLTNLVNTCYINSVIQILRHTDKLNTVLDSKSEIINRNKDELFEWYSLKNLLWKEECIVSPKRWIYCIKNSKKMKNINNTMQQDVTEFLIMLLDIFHDNLKRDVKMSISGNIKNNYDILSKKCYNEYKKLYENNYSEIIPLFYGIEVKNIQNIENNNLLSIKIEPFSILTLSIPNIDKRITLYDCLDEYCKNELLVGENMWYNEKIDKKEPVKVSTKFFQLPDILIICIKQYTDIKKLINFPIQNLDLNKYMLCPFSEYIYDLYAVCNHEGNTNFGHYTSLINYDNKWFKFNDTTIKKVSCSEIISPNAYCLFYKKKTL